MACGRAFNTVAVLAFNNLPDGRIHGAAKVTVTSKGTIYRIAVGRIDGKVHIYDSTGNLLAAKVVNVESTRVLGMQWVSGVGPPPIDVKGAACKEDATDLTLLTSPQLMLQANAKHIPQGPKTEPPNPEEMHKTDSGVQSSSPKPYERPLHKNEFLDLFSPIKLSSQPISQSNGRQPKSSFYPIRPRVLSQTFQKVAQVKVVLQDDNTSTNPPSCHAEACLFDDLGINGVSTCTPTPRVIRKTSAVKRFANEQPTIDPPIVSANAAILADLRRLGAALPVYASEAVAPAPSAGNSDGGTSPQVQQSNLHRQDTRRSSRNLRSNQLTRSHGKEHDIWLTSDSETEHPISHRSRRAGRTSKSGPKYSQGASKNLKDRTPTSRSVVNEFCPSSSKVRELFPRSSSIARDKKQQSQAGRNNLPSCTISDFKPSAVDSHVHRGRRLNTARESEKLAVGHSTDVVADDRTLGQDNERTSISCQGCAEKSVKLTELEAEVIRLKGELVLLKTIPRRNGHKISYDS